MLRFSVTTLIIGSPLTSINGFGKVYPAFSNLEPAPAIGIRTFNLLSVHFGIAITLFSFNLFFNLSIVKSEGLSTLKTFALLLPAAKSPGGESSTINVSSGKTPIILMDFQYISG